MSMRSGISNEGPERMRVGLDLVVSIVLACIYAIGLICTVFDGSTGLIRRGSLSSQML